MKEYRLIAVPSDVRVVVTHQTHMRAWHRLAKAERVYSVNLLRSVFGHWSDLVEEVRSIRLHRHFAVYAKYTRRRQLFSTFRVRVLQPTEVSLAKPRSAEIIWKPTRHLSPDAKAKDACPGSL